MDEQQHENSNLLDRDGYMHTFAILRKLLRAESAHFMHEKRLNVVSTVFLREFFGEDEL